MKLSKSKLALAKVINENGGWKSIGMFSSQDGSGRVDFYHSEPHIIEGNGWWTGDYDDEFGINPRAKTPNNWHKTILSREEYYQAYPVSDADGWIEWGGGECPVEAGSIVDVRYMDGRENFHVKAMSYDRTGSIKSLSATCWGNINVGSDIVAYRPHKPEVKPEFCESVAHGIPEPESIDGLCAKVTEENKHQYVVAKPTIEQLAQDYRNKLDFAKRKQQEADAAKDGADARLKALEIAAEDLGFKIEPITTKHDGLQKIANYNEGCSNALSIKWCN